MEQAVNQFNKGLQMDTHPMVQGNDTLSDALNATFVTMNGNEVVLQNDMGNRKIDKAFLPAGYEPVGMKEYGGVIYVAAYNPLTSRGQVGSFPSPQRKINTQNSASLLDFNSFLEIDNNSNKDNRKYNIKVNNITVPISINEDGETITLHTGDKFSIYSNGITSLLPYICPSTFQQHLKNNLFTFQIGLFNSQNEFIDITDKLKLWDLVNNGIHYNYYINDSEVTPSNNGEDDLIKARNCLDINTYSYKMASPLYLRAIINHVDNVSYSIIGDKKENGECKIYIDATYTYNCVDTINNEFFKIEFNGELCSPNESVINPIFLPEQEKYQLTLSYEIDDVSLGDSSTFEYTIKFPLLYDTNFNSNFGEDFNFPIYQKSLEQSGTLNSTLFGTDTVNLKGYRYYYDQNTNNTTLDVSIESYPKKGSEYTIYPVIYNNSTDEWELPKLEGNPPGTGSYSIIFNHFQIQSNHGNSLESREQYKIKFVKEQGALTENIDVPDPNNTWQGMYVTTPIFNGNYIGKESSATLLNGEYNYETDKNAYIKSFYDIKKFILTPQIECTYSQRKSRVDTEVNGNIIYSKTSQEQTGIYNIQDSYTVSTYITPSIKINNQELYPKEIDNLLSIKDIKINDSTPNSSAVQRTLNDNNIYKDGSSYKYSTGLIDLSKYSDTKPVNVINITEEYSSIASTNELSFKTTVLINNYIKGDLIEKDNIPYNYKITSFWDYIRTRYYNSDETKFNGVVSPYVSVDIIGSTPSIIIKKGKYEDISWLGDDPDRQTFGSTNAYPQDSVNAALLSASENLLILDVNTENYMAMCYEPVYEGMSLNEPFKRLWLKTSEKEYTPIYASYHYQDQELGKAHIFDNSRNEGGLGFKYICKHIPHYFAYTSDSGSFGAKIIDYNRTSKTNEFDITSEVNINLEAQIKRNTSDNFKFEVENNDSTNINQQLSFSEPNIISNEKIQDEYDNLRNFRVNCILEHPNSAYDSDDGTRVIEYKDFEGNDFDPLYVYYSKPVNVLLGNIYNGGFVKSYRAVKFKTEKGDDFPELKPSNELYHASNGKPHPYVNPIVYPAQEERANVISDHQDKNVFDSYPHYAAYKKKMASGYNPYPPGYGDDILLFQNIHDNNKINDKHTMQQINLDESDDAWCIYLDTKNIFDFDFIRHYKLYNWEKSGDPMDSEWVDADTALQN